MVRTPLARRINENDHLNSAYVTLPCHEEVGVNAIVDRLNATGNEDHPRPGRPRTVGYTITFAWFSSTLAYSLVPDVAIPILLVTIAPRFFKRSLRIVSGP